MHESGRRWTMLGPNGLAMVLLLSTQVLLSAPAGRAATKPTAYGPGSVAIAPFVFIGRIDEDLTRSFLERLASLKTGSRIVDEKAYSGHLDGNSRFRSDAPIGMLLKAARAAKAEVLILGEASRYKFLDAPGIQLRVRVINVQSGKELNRSLAKETSWTLPGAKREAGSTAARNIAKQWRAE